MKNKKDNRWQLFLILILAFAVMILTVLSYFNHRDSQDKLTFFENEKVLFKQELNGMIKKNEALLEQNTQMSLELASTKTQMLSLRDSIDGMTGNYDEVRRFRRQLRDLRQENEDLVQLTDSLTKVNASLVLQIEERDLKLSQKEVENAELVKNNTELNDIIQNGATLRIDDVTAKAFLSTSGRLTQTTSSKDTNVMETCFTILPNNIITKGDKEVFFQIIGPNGRVLKPKFSSEIAGKTIQFSRKRVVDFNSKSLKVCDSFNLSDYTVDRGTYIINIYYANTQVGTTLLALE